MRQFIVDTTTWEEQEYAQSMPCHCDGNPLPQWSPDSSRFLHTTLEGATVPGRSYLTKLYDPTGVRLPKAAPGGQVWLDAEHYVSSGEDPRAGKRPDYTFSIVDMTSGAKMRLNGLDEGSEAFIWSPDRTRFVTREGVLAQIVDARTGERIGPPAWGWFYGWSPDGRLFATFADESDCGPAVLIYRAADGEYVHCAPASREGAFKPDGSQFAYLQNDPPDQARSPGAEETSDVRLLDLRDGSRDLLLSDLRGFLCAFWSPEGRWLFVSQCLGL